MPQMPKFEQKQKANTATATPQAVANDFVAEKEVAQTTHNNDSEELLTYGKQTKFELGNNANKKNNAKKKPKITPFEVGNSSERNETDIEKEDNTLDNIPTKFDPTLDLSKYTKPNVELLDKYGRDLYLSLIHI